jgi:hypothetical protein
MNQKKSSTSIRNILKEFRNHFRIARTLITKRAIHEAFITLQNKIPDEKTIDQKNQKNSRIEDSRIASMMIVLAYAKRNIRSTIVFI